MSTRPSQSAYTNTERLESEYIKLHGERGVETIVDAWMDTAPKFEGVVGKALTLSLRAALLAALRRSYMSDLQAAEWAGSLVGNVTFEEFCENEESE